MSNTTISVHQVASVVMESAKKIGSDHLMYHSQHMTIKTKDGSQHQITLFWEDGMTPGSIVETSK